MLCDETVTISAILIHLPRSTTNTSVRSEVRLSPPRRLRRTAERAGKDAAWSPSCSCEMPHTRGEISDVEMASLRSSKSARWHPRDTAGREGTSRRWQPFRPQPLHDTKPVLSYLRSPVPPSTTSPAASSKAGTGDRCPTL